MPVKTTRSSPPQEVHVTHTDHMSIFAKRIFGTLLGILLVYVIFLVGTMIRNNIQKYEFIGQADRLERTITVDGQGKVAAMPDIAMTTMGMIAEGKTVAEAQEKNTTVMNSLIEKLKGLGVEANDIQTTNYNIYPQYNYNDRSGRELLGYEVSQQVTVKIRDLSKANQVLSLAGEVGANNVSGLQFTVDDREVYKAEARDLAMQKVVEKARMLSRTLGVKLVEVVAYNEYEGGNAGDPTMYKALDAMGGGLAPTVESGSMDVVMNVQVTFEIR